MTSIEHSTDLPLTSNVSIREESRIELVLGRIDLIAIIVALLGMVLAGAAAVVLALIELTKLISGLCSNPLERWLLIGVALAMIWVTVRWRKSCAS